MGEIKMKYPRGESLEQIIQRIFKPLARAYILGYASSTTPRLLALGLTLIRGRNRHKSMPDGFGKSVLKILRGSLELQRFPTFCAALVGGYTSFKVIVRWLVQRHLPSLSTLSQSRLSKFISAFIAAWLSLELIHSKMTSVFTENVTEDTPDGGQIVKKVMLGGRTIDLTLFAVTRALDVIVGVLWSHRKIKRSFNGNWSKLDELISKLADPMIFSVSSALIMFNWVYSPDRLPRSYYNWIKSAAAVDMRLVTGLKQIRENILRYGVEPKYPHVFTDMCRDYNWPIEWANHAKTVPVPCKIVHLASDSSCEYHAISRFIRSTAWALSTYLPLNLLLAARNPSLKSFNRAVKLAFRSSMFLGTFVALFFYGICLVRSRIGPIFAGESIARRQYIDSGLCVCGGCIFCGWSVLIENAGRRRELGLFVAPRALATLTPRKYPINKQWRETLVFSLSTAVVFTAATEKPNRVRGLLGRILESVLVQKSK